MEGPMVIKNVSVVNNNFLGTANGDQNIHPSAQATSITVAGNQPHKSAPIPNNITAFCLVGKEQACRMALAGSTSDFKCSADYEHVEQHMLPPYAGLVHIDATLLAISP